MSRSNAVNVQTFINDHPFSPFQWLIFFMCFIIVLLDGFDTAAIGFIAPSLIAEWGITRPALAPVLSAALFGLACGALVSGPLSDRLGRRSMLLGSVLLFGVTCFASAFSNSIITICRACDACRVAVPRFRRVCSSASITSECAWCRRGE